MKNQTTTIGALQEVMLEKKQLPISINTKKKRKLKQLILILCLQFICVLSYTQIPYLYYRFDGATPNLSVAPGCVVAATCSLSTVNITGGILGTALQLNVGSGTQMDDATSDFTNVTDFTVELIFKLDPTLFPPQRNFEFFRFENCDASIGHDALIFNADYIYNYLGFPTNTSVSFSCLLNGTGRKSLEYYLDNNWHHIAFVFKGSTGEQIIYVDGQSPTGFTNTFIDFAIGLQNNANWDFYLIRAAITLTLKV